MSLKQTKQLDCIAEMAKSGPRRKFSSEKGKGYYELNDEEPSFTARYLGMARLDDMFQPERGHEVSARCVDKLHRVLQNKSKQRKVALLVSSNISRGLTVSEKGSNKAVCYELYNIAFCSTDIRNQAIFSFIADCDGEVQCHVFAFKTEEMAKAMCLALSDAFTMAHGEWMRKQKREESKRGRQEITLGPLFT